jgi:hypothetical protein
MRRRGRLPAYREPNSYGIVATRGDGRIVAHATYGRTGPDSAEVAFAEEHAEIAEVDMNPVIVSAQGAVVVDARVRVEQPPPRRPWPAVGA